MPAQGIPAHRRTGLGVAAWLLLKLLRAAAAQGPIAPPWAAGGRVAEKFSVAVIGSGRVCRLNRHRGLFVQPGAIMAVNPARVLVRAGVRCNRAEMEPAPELVSLMGCGEGLPAPLIYRKGWALLGYLAMESSRLHSRAALAALLWPSLGEASALTNLRQVLTNLNRYCVQVMGEGVLHIERSSVRLLRPPHPLFDIDLINASPCQSLHLLDGQAMFLEGMEDIAGSEFHQWLETARQMLDVQLIGAAERCCDEMIAADQWEGALPLARALVRHDAWNEEHARRMMRIHAGSGMRAAAVGVYRRIESVLRAELGVDTTRETRELLAQICGNLNLRANGAVFARGEATGMLD